VNETEEKKYLCIREFPLPCALRADDDNNIGDVSLCFNVYTSMSTDLICVKKSVCITNEHRDDEGNGQSSLAHNTK
jgi:hypothetical protein